jgi:hypothetical protein
LATQIRQALLLGLAYNIYRLRHRFAHGGCQQSPTLMGILASVASKGVMVVGSVSGSQRLNVQERGTPPTPA